MIGQVKDLERTKQVFDANNKCFFNLCETMYEICLCNASLLSSFSPSVSRSSVVTSLESYLCKGQHSTEMVQSCQSRAAGPFLWSVVSNVSNCSSGSGRAVEGMVSSGV